MTADDEVVIAEPAHEANAGPWVRAAARAGAAVKVWEVDRETLRTAPIDTLVAVLSPNTKIVAFPHVSNLLGEVRFSVPSGGVLKRSWEKGGGHRWCFVRPGRHPDPFNRPATGASDCRRAENCGDDSGVGAACQDCGRWRCLRTAPRHRRAGGRFDLGLIRYRSLGSSFS